MNGKKISFIFYIVSILCFISTMNSVNSFNIEIDAEGNIIVDGEIDENARFSPTFNSPLNNITPNYQIMSIVDRKTINAGEKFTISFQISGNGKVVSNKFISYFPEELLKDEPVYYMYIAEYIKDNETFGIFLDKYPDIQKAKGKVGACISLVNAAFKQISPDSTMIFGESVNINGRRPIKIKVNSSENAPSGDHVIKINFVYSDGESWYSSQEEVTIHIRDWYENMWLTILIGMFLVILTYLVDRKWLKLGRKLIEYFSFNKKKDGLENSKEQKNNNQDMNDEGEITKIQ